VAFGDWLVRLDRRWIFLTMGLLVLGPLIFPLSLPLHVTPPVQAFVDAVDKVPNGSTVLMSCAYDPASIPEMVPMTRTALKQLFDKNCKVVVICLWNGGPGLVDRVVRSVADENHKVDGVDWVNLGFKEGREAVRVLNMIVDKLDGRQSGNEAGLQQASVAERAATK